MSVPASGRRWLTVREAADYLAISPRTLERWTSERRVVSARIGGVVRYDRGDLDSLMEKTKRAAYPANTK